MDKDKVNAMARGAGIADTEENNKAAVSKSKKKDGGTFLHQILEGMKAKRDAGDGDVEQLDNFIKQFEEWAETAGLDSALGNMVEGDWNHWERADTADNAASVAHLHHQGNGGMQMMPAGYQGEATFPANYWTPQMHAVSGLNLHEAFQFGMAVGANGRLEKEIQALREDRDKERQFTLELFKVAQGNSGCNVPGNGGGVNLEGKIDRLTGLLETNIAVTKTNIAVMTAAAARGKE